jgi:hypothetical protein
LREQEFEAATNMVADSWPLNQQQMSANMVLWEKILSSALGVLLTLVVLLWTIKAYRDAHYFDNYDPSAPLNFAVNETTEVNKETPEKGYTITKFTFDGYKSEKIPALISLPMKPKGKKFPAVIFLHGIGQDKNFLKEIASPFNQTGFALVGFDQYTQGERKLRGKQSFLARLEAFGQRPAKTINETRRLIDYLSTHPALLVSGLAGSRGFRSEPRSRGIWMKGMAKLDLETPGDIRSENGPSFSILKSIARSFVDRMFFWFRC